MSKIIKKEFGSKMATVPKRSSVGDMMPTEGGGVLNKKVMDATQKAELIIQEANREAEAIRAEAKGFQAQIASELEKAKKDGYAKGRDEGLSSVTEMAVKLNTIKAKFYTNAEPEVIKLVMTIAEKVIGKMVRENEGAIKSIVRQAVESVIGERITVHLNPEDHKVITSSNEEFRDVFDRSKRIAFKEDEMMSKGGCIVETEVGTIDARLETQLKAIKKALQI